MDRQMETLELEFFDLSNASTEEVNEIKGILSKDDSNKFVVLPWDVQPTVTKSDNTSPKTDTDVKLTSPATVPVAISTATSVGAVMGQALLYAPQQIPPPTLSAAQTATQLPVQSSDVVPPMEAFMTPLPPMSAASAIGAHYAAPYLVPRTLPYLRAYPHHVGVPLFTCTLPGSSELSHAASPYASFVPIAAPAIAPTHLEKPIELKEDYEIRLKAKSTSGERQFSRRNKKKHSSASSYYSAPDYGPASDVYNDPGIVDESALASVNLGSNRLTAMPCVPIPVPQSAFPVTSGTLPMPSYPPGLHPLSYSQISGPQAPAAPVYYVPVFNHTPYSRYIAPATTPVMLPVSSIHPVASIHPASESDCSAVDNTDDVRSSESLAASSESIGKTSDSSVPIESDQETSPNDKIGSTNNMEEETPKQQFAEEVVDICLQENTDTVTELAMNRVVDNEHKGKISHKKAYKDSSRCWADLFKKQCTEMNGLDSEHVKSNREKPRIDKDITNGKLYNVPNDSVM